jgi:hypothetical protein
MRRESSEKIAEEKRILPRSIGLTTHQVEIKLVGKPIYQFKVRDVSPVGASFLVRDDSGFLNLIEVNQIIDIEFISQEGSRPSGIYQAEIKHISRSDNGRFKGHRLVGISIFEKLQ